MSMTNDARVEFLTSLGLTPDAETLARPTQPTQAVVAEVETDQPAKPKIRLAPKDVDPHTMPVTDIVFDPRLLDDFPSLSGPGMAAASRHLFELYKSPGRNKDRNSLLHRRIGEFIAQVRRSRETGTGHVKEKVKASKSQRDLAAFLAENGYTEADLIQALAQTKKEG